MNFIKQGYVSKIISLHAQSNYVNKHIMFPKCKFKKNWRNNYRTFQRRRWKHNEYQCHVTQFKFLGLQIFKYLNQFSLKNINFPIHSLRFLTLLVKSQIVELNHFVWTESHI